MEKMKELYGKVAKSKELQKKLIWIANEAEEAGVNKTNQRLINFAADAGYEISIEEMKDFFLDLAEQQIQELNDAELDMVAGGKASAEGLVLSLGTLGYFCAVGSALSEIQNYDCGKFING